MAIEPKPAAQSMRAVSAGAVPAAGAKQELKPLKRGDCALFEFSNNVFRVVVQAGVSPRELDLHPTFWNALADEVREGDEIKAHAMDRAWIARFEVVDAIIGRAVVRLAYVIEGAPRISGVGPKPIPANHDIRRKVSRPHEPDGYEGFREADNVVLSEGSTYQECYENLLKHANFQSAAPTKYVP